MEDVSLLKKIRTCNQWLEQFQLKKTWIFYIYGKWIQDQHVPGKELSRKG